VGIKMNRLDREDFLTIPRLEQIPFLVHGFGTSRFRERNFKNKKEWKGLKFLFLDQVHSNVIHLIEKIPSRKLKGDAMVTKLPSLLLVIRTADCLPVFIVDEFRKVIAAVHCGWRGSAKRVVQRAIEKMKDRYGSDPSSLLAGLGPCIGPGCYEVGDDVLESFVKNGHPQRFFRAHPLRKGKYFFDLRGANLSQIQSLGVKEENVFSIALCTHCDRNFLSFRRDRNKTARMLSFIGITC
jgi:YfiH family protein